jgi:hypothetical protein
MQYRMLSEERGLMLGLILGGKTWIYENRKIFIRKT